MNIKKLAYLDGLRLGGICNTREREELIEEAITELQNCPQDAFKGKYLGIKNYASFGDQREDHSYGMCPRHGTIVFSVGRSKDYKPEHANHYINLLLLFRDDKKGIKSEDGKTRNIQQAYDLYCDCINKASEIEKYFEEMK